MSKIRIIYIVSLVILAVLIGFTVFQPMTSGSSYSEVQKEQLLETESEWIIQFSIINREGDDQNYTIDVLVGDKSQTDTILIRDGAIFNYIQHIPRAVMPDGDISFDIYKEGEATPFEQATYHLK